MDNEMGNQNLFGMQEQYSTQLEDSRKSMEAIVASINANAIQDVNQQVSSPKEDIHEYNTVFPSEDSSGTSDPIEKQTFDGREKDKTETQAPEGSQKASMGSNHHKGMDVGMQLVSSSKDDKLKPMRQIIAPSQPQPCSECTVWVADIGNKMGNQNVPGKEQDSTKLEASRETKEATVASINANGIDDANQQVSSLKEGIHEYNTGFAYEDSSGTSDPIEKQTFDGREQDKTETQAPEGSRKASMGSNLHNGIDAGTQLVSSSKDDKLMPLKQIIEPLQTQPCSECTIRVVDMGNEMGNQNVSGMHEQDSTKLEASRESTEATVASIHANGIEDANQHVSSPKEGIHEYNTVFAPKNSSKTSDPIEKQTFDGRGIYLLSYCATPKQDKTETQASEGSQKASMDSNHQNGIDGGMQSVLCSKDGKFHQPIGPPSEENLSRTIQIHRQSSSQKEKEETRNSSLDTQSMVCSPRTMEMETLKSGQHESTIAHTELPVSASKDWKTNVHTGSPSEENLCRTYENKTESQASIGGEEKTRNPSLDSKSMVPNSKSVESETANSDQHTSNISHAEPSIPSSENGKSNENTGSASKDNSSRANDNQIQRQASIEGEGKDARNSSLDTKFHNLESVELENLKSDPQESTIAHTQLFVEASRNLRGSSSDVPRSSGPQDSEEKGHKLEAEVADSLHGSYILHSYSEIEKVGKDMPKENTETQQEEVMGMSNINGVKSEMIGGIEAGNNINGIEAVNRCRTTPIAEVENRGGEEPTLSNSLGNDGKDCRDSQSEALVLTRSPDSCQIEASEPESRHVVLTNDREMIENGPETEQNVFDSNITLLSEELVEESNTDETNIFQTEFVMTGTDHGERRKGSELCDSYKPKIQSGFLIDDENVIMDVFKLNMHDNNQSLVSDEHCEELEEETKMVIVVDTVPTESILAGSNHEERKPPTYSSPSLDPAKNEVTIEAMKRTEDAYLIKKGPEGWGTIDSSLSQLHPIEPVEDFLPPDPISLVLPQDPKQDRLMETETVGSGGGSTMESNQSNYDEVDVRKTSDFSTTNTTVQKYYENETSKQDQTQHQGQDQLHYQEFTTVALLPSDITVDGSQGQESTCDLTNQTCGIDLKSDFRTQVNNDYSITEMNQDNIKVGVDVRAESNFELYTPSKESEAPANQPNKRFCAKGQVLAFASCVLDAQETDSIPEVEIQAEVCKLHNLDFEFPPKARIEEFNRTPLLCPEKVAKGEEFEVLEIQLNKQLQAYNEFSVTSCRSETQETDRFTTDSIQEDINFHVEVGKSLNFDFEHPIEARTEESDRTPLLSPKWTARGTQSSALRAGKRKSGKDQLQYEEKLRTPLLNFLKEGEKHMNESTKKNKDLDAKKSAKDGWNSYTKKGTATSSRVREKRGPKYTFFSNCMGCTEVIR